MYDTDKLKLYYPFSYLYLVYNRLVYCLEEPVLLLLLR
jgi:hypothetical protein